MQLLAKAALSVALCLTGLLASCATASSPSSGEPSPAPTASLKASDTLVLEEARHAFFARMPTTVEGKPLVIEPDTAAGKARGVAVAYDEAAADPIAKWGSCMSAVTACYGSGDLGTCVSAVPRCADDAGGPGCCPRACIFRFEAELEDGIDARKAMHKVFYKGDCVQGMTGRDEATAMEEGNR